MIDLSIIVPVYNTKPIILKRCLNSMLNINSDISCEIILLDDGSDTNNSMEYKKIVNEYSNITSIYRDNSGVSATRNLGIKMSNGKYLMFVDSDDVIYSQSIKPEYFIDEADVIVFDKMIINNKNSIISREFDNIQASYIDSITIIEKFISENKFHNPFAKILRKEFIVKNNIDFNVDFIQGEDALFNLEVLSHNPKVYYTNEILYGYYFDYSTYDNRWLKYPEKIFMNFKSLYDRKIQTIDKFNFKNKEEIRKSLNKNYLNAIYSYSLILCKEKNNKYKFTLNNMSQFSKEITQDDLNLFMKIKKFLLANKNWKIMHIINKFRKFYIKYIKRNYKF